ncbi:hypothetical protein VOLCADRAFT_105090 [Volvox carteri f. nagariensis]|uniref:Protein kinase domain-containing protein n=1 Tax=Volvox carteri f. nagariensis TaxID=3068 RepID=D8TYC7_VOLCA|nr:uncharacterized protein VOLCADRAFT_105090 [Volvox carteri f. nagariensis]EFJ47619.1 hypothetical protein VOLCADRAFT_105090 [Volvox carteri f. nagariensis]|eukprot:XP_002951443.1 hypothetical protein VOLCADRAFT_105090 [Volvox carteri f. nagariensis]
MSEDEDGILGKARRLFSCLSGFSDDDGGEQRLGAHGNGTLPKAPGQPAGLPRPNSSAGVPQAGAQASTLRHNPIDVCLTMPEAVSVLQGNPSQRTFEALWCGVPANMLAQPDMIAVATEVEAALVQLIAEPTPQSFSAHCSTPAPGTRSLSTKDHHTANARLDLDGTSVCAPRVFEHSKRYTAFWPSSAVLPVLACAKVTCRAHIGSPGDEHVTQRIIAEVHIVTPRLPGLVPLTQWLQERWPQCELTANGEEAEGAAAAAAPNAAGPAGAGGGATIGGGGAGAAVSPSGVQAQQSNTPNPQNHRLSSATAATGPGVQPVGPGPVTLGRLAGGPAAAAAGNTIVSAADGRSPKQASSAAASGAFSPTRSQDPGQSGPGPGAPVSRLGVSQPIAEGVAPRDYGRAMSGEQQRGQQQLATTAAVAVVAAAAPRASESNTEDQSDGRFASACIPCLGGCFAPLVMGAPPPAATPSNRPGDHPGLQAEPGRALPRGTPAPRGAATGRPATEPAASGAMASAAPAAQTGTGDVGAGTRRLAGPNATQTLAPGRQRLPLPPPPPQRPQLPLREALEVLICLAEALRNLHRRGLTHGSLTPKTIQLQLEEAEAAVAAAAAAAASTAADPAGVRRSEGPPPPGSCLSTQPLSSTQALLSSPSPRGLQQASAMQHAGGPGPGGGVVPPVATSLDLPSLMMDTAPGAPGTTDLPESCSPLVTMAAADATALVPGSRVAAPGEDTAGVVGCMSPSVSVSTAVAAAAVVQGGQAPSEEPPVGAASDGLTAPLPVAVAAAVAAGQERLAVPGAAPTATTSLPAVAAVGLTGPKLNDAATVGAPAPSHLRVKSSQPVRRRVPGIRAMLPLPAVGPAVLQLQTWGRARPISLARDHMLWCAPELLNGGGVGWGPPLLARRSGNGSGSLGLGPLDQSLGCRGGNRLRGGNHHLHGGSRHFGDGSYGGSMGGNSRRFRCPASMMMGQDTAGAASPNAHGITPSCDVYSLGMLMWYLVSGQPPFEHLATQDVRTCGCQQVLRVKEIGSLDEQLPFSTELPAGYIQLARRCWAPLPMQRPSVNVVLSEMRSLRAQLLGAAPHQGPQQQHHHHLHPARGDLLGEHGCSSLGEMTGDSRMSFTLSLPLSSRDLSNGEEYSLVRPPLELAFGANDASGAGGRGAAGGAASGNDPSGGSGGGGGPPPPPPPPLLKTALPAALLTALTAPRRASGGGGSGLMDDDDNYSDTDRFTEHDHTEASGTPYSSPTTAGTTGGGARGAGGGASAGGSARLRTMTATTAAARSFRMFRKNSKEEKDFWSILRHSERGRHAGRSPPV